MWTSRVPRRAAGGQRVRDDSAVCLACIVIIPVGLRLLYGLWRRVKAAQRCLSLGGAEKEPSRLTWCSAGQRCDCHALWVLAQDTGTQRLEYQAMATCGDFGCDRNRRFAVGVGARFSCFRRRFDGRASCRRDLGGVEGS